MERARQGFPRPRDRTTVFVEYPFFPCEADTVRLLEIGRDLRTLPYHGPALQTRLQIQLSMFMFLQYFIWGSWYVSMGSYMGKVLNFTGGEIGAAYGAFAIGAMISPFFVGLIADRFFASEKLLGALGILGGGVMFVLANVTEFGAFYPLLILYCATYVPTLALGNSLSLHQLENAKTAFPRVKMLSAVGWIAGGLTVSALKAEANENQFYLAGVLSIIFGIYCFTLPHTPPKKTGANVSVGEILGLDALSLLKKRSFAIFIACMFLICVPLYFYFVNMHIYLGELKWENAAAKMTIAQVSDVVFLFLLAIMLRVLGYKLTIFIGIFAWVTRYFCLTGSVEAGEPLQPMLIFIAIGLHGVCYDFLFIAGQLYVDDESNERMRGAAQGFIAFILWGVGNFVGSMIAGQVQQRYEHRIGSGADMVVTHSWESIWIVPAIGAVAVMVVFLIFFREPRKPAEVDPVEEAKVPGI
jgi:nucleoside transporter